MATRSKVDPLPTVPQGVLPMKVGSPRSWLRRETLHASPGEGPRKSFGEGRGSELGRRQVQAHRESETLPDGNRQTKTGRVAKQGNPATPGAGKV